MGRTLYINQTSKPVIFRDGPSIWVEEEGKAGRRIPARLVGRVIIIGNVKLDSGTITLFAENNTPITFMNNRTDETAVVIPYNHRLPDHYKEQKIFLDSKENIEHFEQWANSKRALLQMALLRRFLPKLMPRFETVGFGEGNYQEILKTLRKVGDRKWLAANGIINNIFRNMIVEHMIKSGLDPHLGVLHRRHNFGLALDLCYIMSGMSDLQTLQFFHTCKDNNFIEKDRENWFVTDAGIRNIIHRFENRRAAMQEKVENILDELFALIREMLTNES
ncbi:MAG: CRISPR-associated endonuclease Cas1 [Nitrospirae bacterium]|nr:CRISPR-associated endonuclease Cas1 [Nitrospirota bacterium]